MNKPCTSFHARAATLGLALALALGASRAHADSVNYVPQPPKRGDEAVRIVEHYMAEYSLAWRADGARPERLRQRLKRPPRQPDGLPASNLFAADDQRTPYEDSLTLRESAMPPALFGRIDANRDGYLVFDEMWNYIHRQFIRRANGYLTHHGKGAAMATPEMKRQLPDPVLTAAEKQALSALLAEPRELGVQPLEAAYVLMRVEAADYAAALRIRQAQHSGRLPLPGAPARGEDPNDELSHAVLQAIAEAGFLIGDLPTDGRVGAIVTRDGTAVVYGMVGAAAQKTEVTRAAQSVPGVRRVKAALVAVGEALPAVPERPRDPLQGVGRLPTRIPDAP